MASNYYLGQDPDSVLGGVPRFFYGLRKNRNGSLFMQRVDQLRDKDTITINYPGEDSGNYNDLEVGVDFFEGIDVAHNPAYANLKWPQYRWDDRSLFYYVNDEGELVVRVNNGYDYEQGSSED